MMNGKQLLEYFESTRDEIVNSSMELIEIESTSFDEVGSTEATEWIESKALESADSISAKRQKVAGVGEHLIIEAFTEINKKPALILGHSDTVHPRGSLKLNPTRIEDGKFYGCGGFDMKVNIAIVLAVFRAFSIFGLSPPRPITFLVSCDEEVGSKSGRFLVEELAKQSEYCLVGEPSADGNVKTGRKGTGTLKLSVQGVPSHAGLDPKRGASAILELARQIEKIHSFTNYDTGTTVNVGTISGGTTTNVVPAEAYCEIDIRFETLLEAEQLEKKIRSLLPFDQRVSLTIEGGINRPPLERSAGVVALFERARELALEFGYTLGESQVGGASDGNFVGTLGVPVLDGLGVRGDGAHTLEEFVYVDDISKRATLVAKLLLEI